MTGVKLPVKLEKLSVEFYKDKDFVLDNSKKILTRNKLQFLKKTLKISWNIKVYTL